MKLYKSLIALCFGVVVTAACAKVEINPAPSATHTARFIATIDAPSSKTSVDLTTEAGRAIYSWSATDEDNAKFTVYEIDDNGEYIEATSVEVALIDNTMAIDAAFAGTEPTSPKYQAIFNAGVSSAQSSDGLEYDQSSDILVSSIAEAVREDIDTYTFSFQRMCAIGQVKLTGLTAGDYLKSITIESTDAAQPLCGTYDLATDSFINTKSKIAISCGNEIESDGSVLLRFVSLPISENKLKFSVSTVSSEDKNTVTNVYEKDFAKGITFECGNVRLFNVAMNAIELPSTVTFNLAKDETVTASADEMSWASPFAEMVAMKGSATTNTNNYYPATPNQSYTSTRFYKNSTLTISPMLGMTIKSVEMTATTAGYATAAANSAWTNVSAVAKTDASPFTVTLTPTDGTQPISATIGATCGLTKIVVTFVAPTISVTGVSLDSESASMECGDVIKLTATVTPSNATNLNVSWSSSDQTVATVSDGTVTAKKAGTTTITVTTEDKKFTASCEITVTEPVVIESTISEILGKADDGKTYKVTGIVKSITNTTYGNFTLLDETSDKSIAVYGLLTKDGVDQQFASMDIEEGDEITIQGKVITFGSTVELKNAYFVSFNPSIVIDPIALSFLAAGETKTINVTPRHFASATSVTATSTNDQFSAEVDGNAISVTAKANSSESKITGALTVSVSDGVTTKNKEVSLSQASSVIETHEATITFNNTNVKIDGASVTGNDSENNEWTITTVGTTSFTGKDDYYQVGSSSKPATSITFTTTLPSNATDISMEAKFGGFSNTAGTVTLKVEDNTIGTGSLSGTNDVTVTSSSTGTGKVLTVTVTGIAKGVKCYYIKATYKN